MLSLVSLERPVAKITGIFGSTLGHVAHTRTGFSCSSELIDFRATGSLGSLLSALDWEGIRKKGEGRHWSRFFHCQENGRHLSNSKNIWLLPVRAVCPQLQHCNLVLDLVHTQRLRARHVNSYQREFRTRQQNSCLQLNTLFFFSSVDANPQVTLYVLFHAFHFSIQISFYSRSAKLPQHSRSTLIHSARSLAKPLYCWLRFRATRARGDEVLKGP